METPNNRFIFGTISRPILVKKNKKLGIAAKYSLDRDMPNPAIIIKNVKIPLIALGINV
jgi:hypothetical protein